MCGRYTLSTPGAELAEVFGLQESVELEPRFNIAPTQVAPIIRVASEGEPVLSLCRWGLVPFWADDPSIGNRMINARAESLHQRRAYREALERRRCIVVADGFFEWKAVGRHKQPYYFSRPDGGPFAMAGLWEQWGSLDEEVQSFTVITTDADATVAPIHDRMPAILPGDSWRAWLSPAGAERRGELLGAAPEAFLRRYPVSTLVNSPRNDSSRCVEAIAMPEASTGEQAGLFD
jgi:putative SOS response-associated peptidase YedK